MTDAQRLAAVRTVHTLIYVVMAVSTFIALFAGITGRTGLWLRVALALLSLEVVVFTGSGMKCPLTGLAVRYGAETGRVFDTLLPERVTRHIFWFLGFVMTSGLLLLTVRWLQPVSWAF